MRTLKICEHIALDAVIQIRARAKGATICWLKAPSSPVSDGLKAATKYSATHRPESLEGGPFEGLGPEIVDDIRRIKSHDIGTLIAPGGGIVKIAVRNREGTNGRKMAISRGGRVITDSEPHTVCIRSI